MKFSTYDLETKNLGGELVIIGLYDGEIFRHFNTIDEFMHYVLDAGYCVYYAHNGGKYDIKYLYDYCNKNYYLKYQNINGHIGLKLYKDKLCKKKICEFRDSVLLLPAGLKQLTRDFNTPHKKLDYDDYGEHKDRKKLIEYLENDVRGLYEVLEMFRETIQFETFNLTLASTAMKIFRKRFSGSEYITMLGRRKEEYRYAYYGGRTEVFKRYGTMLHYYDVNSLYPYCMKHFQYPFNVPAYTKEYMPGKLGLYKVRVKTTDAYIPILPYRNGVKLLFPNGQYEGWYYSPEIELALENGYELEFLEGYVWVQTYNPFSEYVKFFHHIKQTSVGAKKFIAKILLNSLYGKFGQREEHKKYIDLRLITPELVEKENVYVVSEEDNLGYITTKNYGDFIHPQVAGFVTSYARSVLYRYMLSVGLENVYYCDTDSIITDIEMPIGGELGELKEEHFILEGIFLNPKTYAFINDKEQVIMKAKGLSVKTLSYMDYEQALKGDYSLFYSRRQKVVGFAERFKRKDKREIPAYHTELVKKTITGEFDKRILREDGITTYPKTIYS